MSKNYRQLKGETHNVTLELQSAYDKGYKQAKAEYSKPEISWIPIPRDGGLQFRCDGCDRASIASYPYCPYCGCPSKRV